MKRKEKQVVMFLLLFSLFSSLSLIFIPLVKANPDTETIRPNAYGDVNDWNLVDSIYYDALNDLNDSTYIWLDNVTSPDQLLNLENPTFSDISDVNSVTIWFRAYATGTGASEKIASLIKTSGTTYEGSSQTITRGSWNNYSETYNDNPYTSVAWTKGEIKNLQSGIRLKTDGEMLNCSEVWVIVDFTLLSYKITYNSITNIITVLGGNKTNPVNFFMVWLQDQTDGWGVVTRTGVQYWFDATLQIGGFNTETWFADTRKQVAFNPSLETIITVESNAHLRFGVLMDESLKIGSYGCDIIATKWDGSIFTLKAGSFFECYASDISSNSTVFGGELDLNFRGNETYIYMTILDRVEPTFNPTNFDVFDVYRVNILMGLYGIAMASSGGDWDDIRICSFDESALYLQSSYETELSNIVLSNNTRVAYISSSFTGECNLTNAESDNWNFFFGALSTGEVRRKYEFDLKVIYENNTEVENANVTITNDYLGISNSWITYANGSIDTLTLDYGHYNYTGGNTIYDYNPYNITITYSNYTYSTLLNATKKEDLTFTLQFQVSANGVISGFGSGFLLALLIGGVMIIPVIGVVVVVSRK